MKKDTIQLDKISNSMLDKIGTILRNSNDQTKDYNNALDLMNKWRVMHAYPLNTFQPLIRKKIEQLGIKDAIVAQRLKRTSSILNKLKREKEMKLSRMQDIGGLRIILKNVDDVYRVAKTLKESKFNHKLHSEKDYIKSPKDSGYRSVHLVYRYNNTRAPIETKDLQIEIQIRTKKQHLWATAVETVGVFAQNDLKSSMGAKKWLEFFIYASAIWAIEENTNVHPRFNGISKNELLKKLYKISTELDALKNLRSYHTTMNFTDGKAQFKNKHILIEIDPTESKVYLRAFNKNDITKASEEYLKAEIDSKSKHAVLVFADSLKQLKKAYPNYIVDTSNLIKHLNTMFNEIVW